MTFLPTAPAGGGGWPGRWAGSSRTVMPRSRRLSAADALECDLVYVLVPRFSLDEIVRTRARMVARADIATVDRSMRLEQQGLTADQLERRIDDYAARLITAGRLWDDPGRP